MTSIGKTLHPAKVATRRKRAVWLTRRNWSAAEIARELNVSPRTVMRYRAANRAVAS